MDISNLMALVNAGFTKDEIFSMLKPEAKPEEKAPEAKPEQKAPQVKPEEKAPEAKPDEAIKALGAKLDYVVNRLNYLAVQGSKQPETKDESVDDILANMLK